MNNAETTIVRRPAQAAQHGLPGDLHPVLARLYAARNLRSADELGYSLDRLLPPAGLKGIEAAVDLLVTAIRDRQHILIVSDFDADGATSCALTVRALRLLGAARVSFIVPNRFEYGYGLTPEIVQVAARHRPDLIITVDNGISSVEGVSAAQDCGIQVLVTDHHLPGNVMPEAAAIVNPNQPGDTFASKCMAGVGVAFYVMLALRAQLRALDWFAQQQLAEPNLASLLDLVALGTVADVVPLDYNNRILVAQGLRRINQGQCCAGIRALVQVAGRSTGRLVASDLGFAVAPRLNAAGRLEDMSLGIACLLADGAADAVDMAGRLDTLNRERRTIEADMHQQALDALDHLHLDASLPRGLCLFDPSWHQGVIGILASRIKERLHRPVIAFAPAGATGIKGSARSVAGLHIRDALDAVATRHPHLLHRFGGHAMAAGLSLERAHLEEFSRAFDDEVARHLGEEDLCGRVLSDGELGADDLAIELAETLRAAGPWGQGFPEPVFDGYFRVMERRIVGEKHLKLVLQLPAAVGGDRGKTLDAIAFNQLSDTVRPGVLLHVAYRLDVNEFRGSRSLQLMVEHMSPVSG